MADDFVINVRQIAQYPQLSATAPTDRYLLQQNGVGGPYMSIAPADLVGTALHLGGYLHLAPNAGGLAWNGVALTSDGLSITSSADVHVPSLHSTGDIFVAGEALATQVEVTGLFDVILENSVWTFNGRKGNVLLESDDILRAGGILQWNPHFHGVVTVPTVWDFRQNDDTAASTAWVQGVIAALLCSGSVVTSFNGRGGDIVLTADDITLAATQPGAWPLANTPPFGDVSRRIATTAFVDEGLTNLQQQIDAMLPTGNFAPLNSPQFTGIPTAPTPNPGTSTGQLATTAFVQAAVTAGTAGVASWNTRTGAVTLQATDITAVGGALLASPNFSGTPLAPTAVAGTNTTQIATTAFVHAAVAAISAGVTSFNTRTGAVTLVTGDITAAGGAPINAPAFTGVPTAPTAAPGTSTTQIATTAFVQAAIAAIGTGVVSFNGRTGAVTLQFADVSAVGGAPITSPSFAGTPTTTTPNPGDNSTRIPTTAWVISEIGTLSAGVASFNGRTGAVTLVTSDVTGAGGAPLASPAFTGAVTAPTVAQTVNDTTVATTAYVRAAVSAAAGVTSFNSRTGNVTLQASDVSGVGGALLASPTFTGSPAGPTAAPGTSTTQLATTAFVQSAIGGVVSSFNGRNGAVTLSAADITGAGGALLASPTFTGSPNAPTPTAGTNNTQIATTAFVAAAVAAAGVTSFNTRTGAVTLTAADITAAGGALLASPTFTGVPAAPTAAPGTNTTQLASTAFVGAAVGAIAAAPGNRVLILSQAVVTTTPVAFVNFFYNFTNTYDEYEIDLYDLQVSTLNASIGMQYSYDGSTWDTGATSYSSQFTYMQSNNAGSNFGGVGAYMNVSAPMNNGASYLGQSRIRLSMPWTTDRTKQIYFTTSVVGNGFNASGNGGGGNATVTLTPLKGVRFIPSGGNITRGVFALYGIVKPSPSGS